MTEVITPENKNGGESATEEALLRPGENCWSVEAASRAAFLIDGEAYFRAFREAVKRAQRSITILAWDIHSRMRLVRDEPEDGYPAELAPFLRAVVAERPGLKVRILAWDYAMVYASEREWLPRLRFGGVGSRIRFEVDDQHPVGGSQHQKLVVIDDRIAFSGGLDLSVWRWDSSEHRAEDDRRVDPAGERYQPFHDVQMLVAGDAARKLGDLARERWQRATGERLRPAESLEVEEDPWPEGVPADVENVRVAIARTLPAFRERREVREVERLAIDSIKAARRFIYIENQYFSSGHVSAVLAESLRRADGPEVVVILPRHTGGWLEQNTMDLLRSRVVARLRDADEHDRLRIYYPVTGGDHSRGIYVHSKLMIIDDQFVRIGSANLSNRSMGLDSECDLAIEVDERGAKLGAAVELRRRLLREHLGLNKEQGVRLTEADSLIRAVEDNLGDRDRTLVPLPHQLGSEVERVLSESDWLDPERPVDPDQWVCSMVPEAERPNVLRRVLMVAVMVLLALLAFGLSKWGRQLGFPSTSEWGQVFDNLSRHQLAPVYAVAAFAAAGLVGLPLNLVLVGAVLAFGPVAAFLCGLTGGYISALAGFGLGRTLGGDWIRGRTRGRLNSLSRELARRGVGAVLLVRLVPVAPFLVVNLAAGASHIRARDFAWGTAIGLVPGMLSVVLLTAGFDELIRRPNLTNLVWLVLVAAVLTGATVTLCRWLKRRRAGGGDAS